MKEKVKILTCCTHFDDIVNYDFLEDDTLTKKLIQYYQDFVFNVNEKDGLELIKKLDDAMYKYTVDYHFAKSLKDTLDVDQIISDHFAYLDQLMLYIVEYFTSYEEKPSDTVDTKWI